MQLDGSYYLFQHLAHLCGCRHTIRDFSRRVLEVRIGSSSRACHPAPVARTSIEAWPLAIVAHQPVLNWIRQRVDECIEDSSWIDEQDRIERLTVTPDRIESRIGKALAVVLEQAARRGAIQLLHEIGEPPLGVRNDEMKVIALDAYRVDDDAAPAGGPRDAVLHDLVDRFGWREQEEAHRCGAGHQIGP